MDPLVNSVTVKDAPGFDLGTLRSTPQKIVSYMVGTQGPFTLQYAAADYNAERVQADMQKEVETLRAIGAIPQAAGY